MARPMICLSDASFHVMSRIKMSFTERKLMPSLPLSEKTQVLISSPLVFSTRLNSATARVRVSLVREENSM
nr:MAG: hypothetical protein [Molluscum contagiosum virus]